MASKRNVNDLVIPAVKKDVFWQIVKRAGVTTPPFSRGDMQEPLFTMIMTAFFALILLVIGVMFPALGGLIMLLIALIAACFGYEWHTWVTMRALNRTAKDVALCEAYDRSMRLMKLAQQAKAKQDEQTRHEAFTIHSLRTR